MATIILPMHIGIDARLLAYRMGGISQYTLHLMSALADLDDDSRYTIFHSRKDRRCHLPAGAPNFQKGRTWTPPHHRLERWALAAELAPYRLDLHHSPDFIPPAAGARRRVITVHDLNFLYYPQFLTAESQRYYRGQIAWAVRVADHILADSYQTRDDLIELLQVAPDKVTTVHLAANPVYEAAVNPAEVEQTLRESGLPPDFILFVGTLEPRKNLSMLFQAVRQLYAGGRCDIPLVLVGARGWLSDQILQEIAQPELAGRVRHLEGISDLMLAHLYHAASVLVLPSHYEGFGLPILEAMHCGCPVICSDRGSLPEVAGEAGLQLPPDDADAWAEGIDRLLADSARRTAMRDAGYRQAAKFSWPVTARRTLEIYQRVVRL